MVEQNLRMKTLYNSITCVVGNLVNSNNSIISQFNIMVEREMTLGGGSLTRRVSNLQQRC